MSDIAELKARIAAAKQFTVTVGPADAPRTIQLQEPDDHQVKLAGIRSGLRGGKDPAAELLFERALLLEAITGWSGVTAADLLRGFPDQAAKAGDKPLDFEADGVEMLLDAQREWGNELWSALVDRMAQRSAAREPAAKN
jgi:hypothetical protein